MRRIALVLIMIGSVGLAAGREWGLPHAKAVVTIKVVDDRGVAVPSAKLDGGFYSPHGDINYAGDVFETLTDTNGEYCAKGTAYTDMQVMVRKEAHYRTEMKIEFPQLREPNHLSSVIRTNMLVVLNRIRNPAPLYARRTIDHLQLGETSGFDLMKGDWVAPRGRGVESDLVFHATGQLIGPRDFDLTLTLTFSRSTDGFLPMATPLENGVSELKLPHQAPLEGYRVGQAWHFRSMKAQDPYAPRILLNDHDANMNYYLRVRSQTNQFGIVTNALYGKILNDVELGLSSTSNAVGMVFTYYLNPTPNDRNVEFSRGNSLFRELGPDEQLIDP